LSFRVSLEKRAEIREWAARNAVLGGVSEAVRVLIDQGLKRDLPKRRPK
jgi:hypothetical protein